MRGKDEIETMQFCKLLIVVAVLPMFGFAAAIENVIALQRPGTGIVDIYYDLIINEGGTTTVSTSIEGGDGEVRMETMSGDIGHVVPGPARHIVWNAQADNPERVISDVRVAITATSMDGVENPGKKKLSGTYYYSARAFPAWWFSYGYSSTNVHETGYTFKSPVYIDRMPVSGALWNKVASWAVKHGFGFKNSYSSSASAVYPNVKDACVWCNARSAMEGLPQCQKTSSGYIYRNSTDTYDSPWGFPDQDGGYRLPYEEEMTSAFKSGVSGSKEGLVTWKTSQYDAIGYVYDDSGVYAFSSLSWSSSTSKPLYCVRDENSRYPITETFPPNYSSPFTIDTRVNSPTFPKDFKIIDIKSKYCNGRYGAGHKALFLSGVHVHCNVEFEVDVYGGDLVYLERVDAGEIQIESRKFTLDVGALAPGESFKIRARSSDGRWSQEFQLNFDIAAQKGATWTASPSKNSIQYRTVELDSFQLFDQLEDNQEDPLEAQKSKLVSNLVNRFYKYPHELQLGVNVCWTMDSSEGIIRGVALFGAQTSADVDKILNSKIRDVSKALQFGKVSGYIKAGVENTWTWDTRSLGWQGHGNYVAVNAGANGCFFSSWIPTPIPWYYSADGGIDVYLRARIANGGLQYAINADKLLYVTLRIGIGVPSVLSIEGSGTGSMFLTYDTEADPNLQRLGMALALALKTQMVGFVIPIWDWTGEWNWVGGENEFADVDISTLVDKAMSKAVTNSASELSRNYTNNWDNASSTSGKSQYSGYVNTIVNQNSTSSSGTPVDIEDDNSGGPGPNPQGPGDTPHESGGGSGGSGFGGNGSGGSGGGTGGNGRSPTKIVVVADDTSRSSDNRATLITISDETNTTFMTEGAVWDDGTPDYCPTTARMTNGCSVVAWMNKREAGTENPTLGRVMSEMEIAAAVWDDETGEWSHQNLTDNSAYDRSPILKTATNGTAAVAWLRNAYTNYIGSAAEPNQVCFARYVDGAWTAETVVVPSIGRVRKLDMAYDGVHAAIVFNEEDDPGSGTTQRLCVVTGDCATWGSCHVVAESSVNNSAAYAYYDETGGLRLVWNDEGAVKTGLYANGTLTFETIDTDGHQVPGDYVFTRAHSGRMALVWREPMKEGEGESAMGPVSMIYNPANGLWTLPCALTWDGKNKTEISAAFNDVGDLEVFYATPNVATNAQGVAETVSSGFSKVTRRHGGDAAILAEDISFSTNVFGLGETVDVTFKVKNLGDETISNVTMRVFDRSSTNWASLLTNVVYVSGLQDGQVVTSTVSYVRFAELKCGQSITMKVPWRIGEKVSSQLYLYFTVSGASGDVLSKNNSATWAHGNANVSIVQAQSRVDERSKNIRHVSARLGNAGLAAVPAGTTVTFRRGDANGIILATKTVGRVLVGDEGIQETGFAWDISTIVPTSNVEVVHVTAELPESSVVEQRTLEAEIPVDVSPIVKSPLTAYSLVYDANGGEGTMPAENPFYDEWGLLASNTFTRAGYVFMGWALSPTGEVAYADGANHWNVPMFSRDTATLYAVWKEPVATPTFSPVTKTVFFKRDQPVAISCTTPAAEIRYTLDGSEPTASSMLYNGAFVITNNVTVKAKAFAEGLGPSETAQAEYVRAAIVGDNLVQNTSPEHGVAQTVSVPVPGTYQMSFDWMQGGEVELRMSRGDEVRTIASVSAENAGTTNLLFDISAAGDYELTVYDPSSGTPQPATVSNLSLSIPDTPENRGRFWIYETEDTYGSTGDWIAESGFKNGKMPIMERNIFNPYTSSTGDLVVITATLEFGGPDLRDDADYMSDYKAGVSMGKDALGTNVFKVLTMEHGGRIWKNVYGEGLGAPTLGTPYTVKITCDYTNRTYTVSLVTNGTEMALTDGTNGTFAFAGSYDSAIETVEFEGVSGNVISLLGNYGDCAFRFAEGDTLRLSDGALAPPLTDRQARWLNSMLAYDAVKTKVGRMGMEDFMVAYLLNLDLTKDGAGLGMFKVTGIEVAEREVRISVTLSRAGAMQVSQGGECHNAPINGLLKLYGGETPSGRTLLNATVISDDSFSSGDTEVFTYPRSGSARFFCPAIVSP